MAALDPGRRAPPPLAATPPTTRAAAAAAVPPSPGAAAPEASNGMAQPGGRAAKKGAPEVPLVMKPGVPMVAVDLSSLPRRPPRPPRVTLGWLLRELWWQLRPEPQPRRLYRPPAEYAVENGKVYYSDGMDEDYEPNLATKALAFVTLGLYIGIPQLLLTLFVLCFWHAWARVALALIVGSAFLPLRPLKWTRVLSSYVFLTWRRYFKFSFVFDESLNAYKDYVIAQFPHGAFPVRSGRATAAQGQGGRGWR